MSTTTRIALLASALAALIACITLSSSRWAAPAPGLVRYTPPNVYAQWWSKTEACSGITAPMPRAVVSWWATPHNEKLNNGGELDEGVFFPYYREIAIQSSHQLDEKLVCHEMLHALLATHGINGHPPEYFVQRCHLTWDSSKV